MQMIGIEQQAAVFHIDGVHQRHARRQRVNHRVARVKFQRQFQSVAGGNFSAGFKIYRRHRHAARRVGAGRHHNHLAAQRHRFLAHIVQRAREPLQIVPRREQHAAFSADHRNFDVGVTHQLHHRVFAHAGFAAAHEIDVTQFNRVVAGFARDAQRVSERCGVECPGMDGDVVLENVQCYIRLCKYMFINNYFISTLRRPKAEIATSYCAVISLPCRTVVWRSCSMPSCMP